MFRSAFKGAVVAGSAGLLCAGILSSPAQADSIYKGTKTGSIDVLGGGHKWTYTDAQYRSTSMKNAQSHVIHVKYKGCLKWRARAAVQYPTGGHSTSDQQTVNGCNKTAYITVLGKSTAKVTLSVFLIVSGDTRSVAVSPIK